MLWFTFPQNDSFKLIKCTQNMEKINNVRIIVIILDLDEYLYILEISALPINHTNVRTPDEKV